MEMSRTDQSIRHVDETQLFKIEATACYFFNLPHTWYIGPMNLVQTSNQDTINAADSLLYSPYNAISKEYGAPTLEGFERLKRNLSNSLTRSQKKQFGALERYIITNDELRPFGSLMPYFIADFFDLPRNAADQISDSWIALYLWSVCIDKVMDNEESVDPDSHMLYAQLLTYFLSHSGKAPISADSQSKVIGALSDAMRYQSYSTPEASLDPDVSLSDIRSGKNLLFYAAGLLVTGDEGAVSKPLANLCTKFSAILQALDDITDIRSDLILGIRTPIIEKLGSNAVADNDSDVKVLEQLVLSGTLLDELSWIEKDLKILIQACPNQSGSSIEFLQELQSSVSAIINLTKDRNLPELRRKIGQIYCTT